jgi:hypothetical protein
MIDLLGRIALLRRPRLLVHAARFGLEDYVRAHHLPRLLQGRVPARSGDALMRLLELEAELDAKRIEKAATYTIAAHVDVLIAIMGEARDLRATRPVPVT